MPVPAEPNTLLTSLRTSLISCATFRRLVGAADQAEASASIYDRYASDVLDENSDPDDPQPEDPYPRAVLDDSMPQRTAVGGDLAVDGDGSLGIFIEFKEFTDEELSAWYSLSITDATDRDHTTHALNLRQKIADELLLVASTAGCLTIQRLTTEVGGKIDPKSNNGMAVWVLIFAIQWEGLP